MTDWLNVTEAATYLKVPPSYVRRLVLERRVRFHKLGKYLRFTCEDLDAAARPIEPIISVSRTRRRGSLPSMPSSAFGRRRPAS